MPTLLDVRSALKDGDKKAATYQLQSILRENPTAEAWLIAAKICNSRPQAIKYARRALMLDPQNHQAEYLLHMFGAPRRTFARQIVHESVDFIARQNDQSVVLKRLSAAQRALLFGGVIVLIVASCMLFSTTFSFSSSLTIADVVPPTVVFNFISADEVMAVFEAENTNLFHLTRITEPQASNRRVIRLSLNDLAYNRTRFAEIFVYDSISAMIDDQAYLSSYGDSAHMVALSNAVLVYPAELRPNIARQLVRRFESLASG
ncbi:MAG: hypothetical protein H7175_14605 [Burkholderiales bacterium]|nr:hypothetical protein [Anaerolineae bacterium]